MSFETISAENRNINQMPLPLSRRRVQCCSLCRQPGHNITTCNSERLREFEQDCANAVRNFENTDDFKNWLMRTYINNMILLKAFVINKYRFTIRLSLDQYIHYVTEYIFRTYKIPNTQQEQTEMDDVYTAFINFITLIQNRRDTENENFAENETIESNALAEYLLYLSNLGSSLMRIEVDRPRINLTIETNAEENLTENCQCSICWDDKELKQFVKLNCNHEFCNDCVKRTLSPETRTNLCCALCRSGVTEIKTRTHETYDDLMVINSAV